MFSPCFIDSYGLRKLEKLAISPPWAQGVGRSNRFAPTNTIVDSKRVDRSPFHRFRPFFALIVPELCQNPYSSASLCQNPSRLHSRTGSAFPELRASSEVSSVSTS